ncbi:hypothetical protein E4T44_02658 [Aureobasidium sp. EXF-8845]|nr:hypothetical protein E4T44_02658 [Aureobasidium sp. EXF-8845]KAI4855979.1 hypothetical protein E4T45_02568 [Aureobasidium sp. EXF-8846]
MAEYFQEITQRFVTLAISDSVINPDFPDCSTCRDIRYVPESSGPMLPNFISYGPSTHQIGRFYPTGTSTPSYSVDDLKPLQTIGLVKTQITVGRWTVICDNENCLEDCAEGFWEKYCRMDIQTKQINSSVQFLGRCTKCNRSFQEHVSGI